MDKRLDALWAKGKDFLGSTYSIMGGAMTWVSNHTLVAAISNAGGFGVLASGAMPPQALKTEIQKTRTLTTRPFGVNLITLNPQLFELIAICIEEKVSHVVLAGGIPSAESIQHLKKAGIKVMGFAPSLLMGKKLVRMEIDALIIEGSEAGGHIGPVSTTVLAQEILPHIHDVPVFIAGGIGRGETIVSYLELGAAGCQLGTRFVCATESPAHPKFKHAFLKSSARDAVVSPQLDPRFPVIPVRALFNKGMTNFLEAQKKAIEHYTQGEKTQKEAQLEIEHFWAGALRKAVIEGDIENGSLMAGQSVGLVQKEQPLKEIMAELIEQAQSALKQRFPQ